MINWIKYPTYLFVFLIFLSVQAAYAESSSTDRHALAMHGAPKYSADFKHLDYANPNAPKGGMLKQAINGHFDTLNNHVILGSYAKGLNLTYDTLMTRVWDEPFTMYGLVAESIDIPQDRSSITFHLRPEARFHDGQPMTVDDVIFSHDAYLNHGHPVRRRVYGLVTNVTKIGEHSVRFDFGEGYDAETALILSMMPVLPKHYWTAEGRDISKTTLEPPLGSGPYRIKSFDPGRNIIYERVKDYWAKDLAVHKGHYNFDTMVFHYYRDDDIAFEAFKAGEHNIRREHDIRKWKTGYDIPSVQSKDTLLTELTHGRPEYVRSIVFNTRRPLFQDRRIRKALNIMFDFNWLNDNLFYGSFKRIDSFFPNSELAAPEIADQTERDILEQYKDVLPQDILSEKKEPPQKTRARMREALALFKQAGWVIKDKKLVHSETGEDFTFEILLRKAEEKKIALSYARSLERLGITITIRQVESAQYQGRLDSFDYDLCFFTWVNSLSPGNEQVNYWGKDAATRNGSRNYPGATNPAIDALAHSIAQAPTRKALVAQTHALDRALMSEFYTIPLYYLGKDLIAYSKDLRFTETTPTYGTVLETWWSTKTKEEKTN